MNYFSPNKLISYLQTAAFLYFFSWFFSMFIYVGIYMGTWDKTFIVARNAMIICGILLNLLVLGLGYLMYWKYENEYNTKIKISATEVLVAKHKSLQKHKIWLILSVFLPGFANLILVWIFWARANRVIAVLHNNSISKTDLDSFDNVNNQNDDSRIKGDF
ncbi:MULTISPECIES: hypothetical protein [unclassified Mycoplasma]